MNEIKCPECGKTQELSFDYIELNLICDECKHAFTIVKQYDKTETSRSFQIHEISEEVLNIRANRQLDERAIELLNRKKSEKIYYAHPVRRYEFVKNAKESVSSFIPTNAKKQPTIYIFLLILLIFIAIMLSLLIICR